MLTTTELKRGTIADWKGRRLITTRRLRNQLMSIPKGTWVTINKRWAGTLDVEAAACGKCGVKIFIRKCAPFDFRWPEPWEVDPEAKAQ